MSLELKEVGVFPNLPTDWEVWDHLSSAELAAEVNYYAAPLLNAPEARDGLYRLLSAKPLERLEDSELLGGSQVLWAVKDETEHPGGAYKLRGAYWNLVSQLSLNAHISEVHCTSTGNHGRGVVEACRWLNEQYGMNLEAVVHVPASISPAKLRALRESGATVRMSDSYELARQETEGLKAASAEPYANLAVIEPYDDPRTMAGQASCGFEIVADFVGDLFTREGVDLARDEVTVWVPGGGGGFAAGCAVALDHYRQLGMIGPNVRVKVAQMENCDALAREYRGDEPLTADALDKASDATAILAGGTLTQRLLGDKRFVADVVTVPKRYVGLAMEILARHHGHPVEPAGALALAASLMYEDEQPRQAEDPRRVNVTVTSGANVTAETRAHFAEAVPAGFKFNRHSAAYLRREVHGLREALARTGGHSAVNKLLVANGPTSV